MEYNNFNDYVEGEYVQVPSNTFDDLYRDVSGNLWTIADLAGILILISF